MNAFIDDAGRIKSLPKKREDRRGVLQFLANYFQYNKFYTEKEVNAMIQEYHTFNDYFLLRRELVDAKLLARLKNGAKYWREDPLSVDFIFDGLTLRNCSLSDEPALMKIAESVRYMEAYTGEPYNELYIRKILTEGDCPPNGHKEFYRVKALASEDCEAAGFIEYYCGYPNEETFWISNLMIERNRQNQGFGSKLVHALSVQLKGKGFRQIGIGVYIKNTPAINFWTKCGFMETGNRFGTGDYVIIEMMKGI